MKNTACNVSALVSASVLFVSAASAVDMQSTIDAAFALQAKGGTLTEVREAIAPHAGDDAADFALGAIDFLIAGEKLTQRAYLHGFLAPLRTIASMFDDDTEFLLWLANDEPAPTTYDDLRTAIVEWVDALAAADKTLAAVEGAFTCSINLPAIRFDFNQDGTTTAAESLDHFFDLLPMRVQWVENRSVESRLVPEDLIVAFDRGDAAWLRGYCNVLMAAGEWALAHGGQELFDHTGHMFFPKAEIAYNYLPYSSTFGMMEEWMGEDEATSTPFDLTDVYVLFGGLRFPVSEPERMKSSLEHLQTAVSLGKEMWAFYDLEKDNDREWIPNPNQTAAFGEEVQVDAAMRDAWLVFLDEADAILHGRKVLRFWRGDGTKGIDVPKVFLEPQEFDLLYWIQGSAAAPYLRKGEFTTPETWAQLQAVFDNRVFRYSFWFN